MENGLQAVILAAGRSSRFNTGNTKLSFTLCGQEMVVYPAKLLASMNIPITFVVGFQKEIIKKIISSHTIPETSFVEQTEQKGTGHALWCTKSTWRKDHILVMNGDVPLVNQTVIQDLIKEHTKNNAAVSFVTTLSTDPSAAGYGRVVKSDAGLEIIEARNFEGAQIPSQLLNAGIYLINRKFLETAISQITPNEKTGEIYITDLVKHAQDNGHEVATSFSPFDYVRGVNTLKELWAAEHIKRSEIITKLMNNGVRFTAAQNVCIDYNVEIGAGTVIGAGAVLLKNTKIGKKCVINAFSYLDNVIVHDNVTIKPHSALYDSEVHLGAEIGPFAHIRGNAIIKENACIGNFVEVNRSIIGAGSKAKHLAYLGDAIVGNKANIGAGAITCNYNGVSKSTTVIQDGAHIGSNTCLIAPVTIGAQALIAAGSVITKDIPAKALALTRSPLVVKDGYAEILRERWHAIKEETNPAVTSRYNPASPDHSK